MTEYEKMALNILGDEYGLSPGIANIVLRFMQREIRDAIYQILTNLDIDFDSVEVQRTLKDKGII